MLPLALGLPPMQETQQRGCRGEGVGWAVPRGMRQERGGSPAQPESAARYPEGQQR